MVDELGSISGINGVTVNQGDLGELDNTVVLQQAHGPARAGLTAAGAQKLPDLIGDWKVHTVEGAIRERAINEGKLEDGSTPRDLIDAELAKEQELYPPGTRAEAHRRWELEEYFVPSVIGQFVLMRDPSKREGIVANVLSNFAKPRFDPFTPIAQTKPADRDPQKTRVVWENQRVMALVDMPCNQMQIPKILVVPKAPFTFLTEIEQKDPALLTELRQVARAIGLAMEERTTTGEARIWVNTPFDLTVKQLHIHVKPNLACREMAADDYANISNKLYTYVEDNIAAKLALVQGR